MCNNNKLLIQILKNQQVIISNLARQSDYISTSNGHPYKMSISDPALKPLINDIQTALSDTNDLIKDFDANPTDY